jgi:hypothetical protein
MTDSGRMEAGARDSHTGLQVWLPLILFVLLTGILATHHVMWRDEVGVFSVATRSTSWVALFSDLHHEGHPVLWYAVLRVGYSITHSNLVLPIASLLIAACAAFLVLRFAPFPLWTRLLIVFGVFLAHEYSVVSRNYGIGILLMFVACVSFTDRNQRPIRLGVVLALMANTSIHAALAAMCFLLVWAMDAARPEMRSSLFRSASLSAIGIGLAGVVIALVSAHPSSDMAFGFSLSDLSTRRVLQALLADPGTSLAGYQDSNIAGAGDLPWARFSIDPGLAGRVITDIALIGVAWALRKNGRLLLVALLATIGYAMVFRVLYTAALRHEGILTFFLISLCWIAFTAFGRRYSPAERGQMALGLLPLLVVQSLALPVSARRDLLHPASSSKAFAALIESTPRYRDAVLLGEPDYMMETMPYYVSNPVFLTRQREFHYRVYFDRVRRQQHLTLTELINIADSVTCATGRIALLSIAYPKFATDSAGEMHLAYRGAVFTWNSAERARLFARGAPRASFTGATTDENYQVFEFAPQSGSSCLKREAAGD